MCLLTDGVVEVDTGNGTVVRHGPGVVLGEIALLRDVPRTATVTARDGGATAYWMDADSFLDAVNRVPRSRARAEAEATRRLER
jgi:CRP-like cAMP-binding protein